MVLKTRDPRAVELGKQIRDFLAAQGIRLFVSREAAEAFGMDGGVSDTALSKSVDIMLVLGGDGTLLGAARQVAGERCPILGINLGSLGFLTEISRENAIETLRRVISGDYETEARALLDVEVIRDGREIHHSLALNDAVISRRGVARLLQVNVTIDERPVTSFACDGVIVASPTGSTAYGLAAGGPIVHPAIAALVLVPICPHMLANRPLIVPDTKVVELQATNAPHGDIVVSLDGQVSIDIHPTDIVRVTKADKRINLVKNRAEGYFDVLRNKLGWAPTRKITGT
ncbi:MAG: NAD(+)/NADH kinase [Deltaproteobacteria bacterium]|nr:NAD(+)/NADH kinase [Deltaproteobacteria bacterium]